MKFNKYLIYSLVLFILIIIPNKGKAKNKFSNNSQTQINESLVKKLELNTKITRKISGGETHAYKLEVLANKFLQVAVDQKGVDIVLRLYSANHVLLKETDGNTGEWGVDKLSWITASEEIYIFEVISTNKDFGEGAYELNVIERDVSAKDEQIISSENLSMEALNLQVEGSEKALNSSIEKYKTVLPLYSNLEDIFMVASTYSSIGNCYFKLSNYADSLDYYNKAYSNYQQLNYERGQADQLASIASIYDLLGEKSRAINYNEKTLIIYASLGDEKFQTIIKNNIALIYDSLGQKQKAVEYYLEALNGARKINYEELQPTIYSNLGVLYSDIGQVKNSFIYHSKALDFYQKKGLKKETAVAFSNIGILYDNIGEPEKALKNYSDAISIFETIGSNTGKARCLVNRGVVFVELGRLEEAKHSYELALATFKAANDKSALGSTLTKLGEVELQLANYQQAIGLLNEALMLRKSVNDAYGQAYTLLLLGKAYFSVGKKQDALNFYKESLTINQSINYHKGEIKALYEIAYVERTLGNLKVAFDSVSQSIEIIESIRSSINTQNLRSNYLASSRQCYELCITILMDLHQIFPMEAYDQLALNFSEKFRARNLLELLTLTQSKLGDSDPNENDLLTKLKAYDKIINEKLEQIIKLKLNNATTEQIQLVQEEVENLKKESEITEVKLKDNNFYDSIGKARVVSLVEIQHDILDKDTMLLEYFLGNQHSYLWVVTVDTFHSYILPSEINIKPIIEKLYNSLNSRGEVAFESQAQTDQRIYDSDINYFNYAKQLGEIILLPLVKTHPKRLLVVSDGKLHCIPFSCLPSPSEKQFKPLVAEHEIINIPSISTLSVIREHSLKSNTIVKDFTIFADPVFLPDDVRCSNKTNKSEEQKINETLSTITDIRAGLSLKRLPFTAIEGEKIAELVEQKCIKNFGFDASLNSIINGSLSKSKYIHFATHGISNTEHPELSGIILSLVNEQGKDVEGFLSLHRLASLKLSADLVVLSACRTGLGKFLSGEGIVGLPEALLGAGTKNVIASLWNVNDRRTAELMVEVYRKILKENLKPSTALHLAQKAMWEKRVAPYYWAAFQIQGEFK